MWQHDDAAGQQHHAYDGKREHCHVLHGKIFQDDAPEQHAVVHDDQMHGEKCSAEKKKNAEENMLTRNMNMGGLCRPHCTR